MRYYWKIWSWVDGHKDVDYTKYAVAPIFIEDKLDETLDTGEIVLDRMPIATKSAFPPKSKFRLERYTTAEHTDTPKKWDFVVEHDDVEEYVGVPSICCHRIHLIEPSVIAQGMHVDNIALTYELQDVDLNYRVVESDETRIGNNVEAQEAGEKEPGHTESFKDFLQPEGNGLPFWRRIDGTFKNSYRYVWEKTESIKNLKENLQSSNNNKVAFTIPTLYISVKKNENNVYEKLFELNTITRIKETRVLKTVSVPGSEKYLEIVKVSGPTSIPVKNDAVYYSNGTDAFLRKIRSFEGREDMYDWSSNYTLFPLIARAKAEYSDKEFVFTTTALSSAEIAEGYSLTYTIECTAHNSYGGYLSFYEQQYYYQYQYSTILFWQSVTINEGFCKTIAEPKPDPLSIRVEAEFNCTDNTEGRNTTFIARGVEYSCYALLRKALLTCDTHLINNDEEGLDDYDKNNNSQPSLQHSIILHPNWNNQLKTTKINETLFEGKNLWEILIQIGYYLHAIPYLEFSEDGTDRFVLNFIQLGDIEVNAGKTIKTTVFNSRNLSEFYTQYDSYVTNLFSPQNEVEEWIVPKTSDSSFLVSNNTAELQLRYPITEVVEFDIIYNGVSKSALSYIFERSIYDILTNDDPLRVYPAKGNALFFTLGGTIIEGLTYVAPSRSGGDMPMALKNIMLKIFGVQGADWSTKYTFNNLRFHVKYRTQDSMRVTQVRPDIQNFMKNSSYEKYPHHEQFYGQQDKIVDSERLSSNLYGKLVRVGNAVFQMQEYVTSPVNEKIIGQIVEINEDAYYITAVESEYYPDAILQKVTYSKNFNQLSNIVTMPSEPRFYEVSERSKIRREVRLFDFFTLTTAEPKQTFTPRFQKIETWKSFLKMLIFKNDRKLPNFAWTRFMADKKRYHKAHSGGGRDIATLFPSSEVERDSQNIVSPISPRDHSDCIVPLLHYPLHDGIVFEWDMEDNFKCGDMIDAKLFGVNVSDVNVEDCAYVSMQPLRYVDIFGRADLMRFALFNKSDWTVEQMQELPKAIIEPPTDCQIGVQGGKSMAVALDKDNREALSFNYQICLLHKAEKGDDDFITFSNLFGQKDNDLKVCLLDKNQSMFNGNLNISPAEVLADNVGYALNDDPTGIRIDFIEPENWNTLNDKGLTVGDRCKCIVFYHENNNYGRAAYIAKNVGKLSKQEKLKSWWIYPVFNS